ncbi:MAG: MFS transporter [Acidimicrobiales bacterium]
MGPAMTTQHFDHNRHDAETPPPQRTPPPQPVGVRPPFSGWVVIGGLFVVLMLSSGIGFYGQGVYLKALVDERGWSTGLTSSATATFFVVSGLAGFAVSGLLQRIDVRRIMVVGLVIAALGLVALGRSTEVWQAFAADVLFGVGFALCGLVPATTTVARWFVRRRSVALSVASTGLSAGGIVVTPFVASLVQDRGIAPVTPWLAAVWVAVAVPVTMLFVRSSPADKGQHPDGDAPAAVPAGTPPGATGLAAMPGATFAEARSTRFYRLLTAAYLFVMLGQVGALSQQISLVSERQKSLVAASVTILAASSVVGRLGGGLLVTRVAPKTFTAALMAVQGCALVAFAFADATWSIAATLVVFGLSVGNLLMLQPLLLAEAFGVREYSRIYSMSSLVATIGVGAGPTVFGVLHDLADYQGAFLVGAVSSLMAFGLFLAAGPLVSYSHKG